MRFQIKLQIIPVLDKVFMKGMCHRPLSKNNLGQRTAFVLISSLRRVENYTRPIIGLLTLFNLALFNIESKILNLILNDKIIDQVALAGPHRILL